MSELSIECTGHGDPVVLIHGSLATGAEEWSAQQPDLPLAALASAPFPKLVVSGGHSDGFEAVCDQLADRIDGARASIQGAGHEIQFTGAPLNDMLRDLWRSATGPAAGPSSS